MAHVFKVALQSSTHQRTTETNVQKVFLVKIKGAYPQVSAMT